MIHGALIGTTPASAKWMRKWGVEPFTAPCTECGKPLTTTLPLAHASGMRGLSAPPCACGSKETPPFCIAWDTMPRHAPPSYYRKRPRS